MDLERVIAALAPREVVGRAPVEVADLAYDTRAVAPGALFFCVRGANVDGHDLAPQAVGAGAAALVVERPLDVHLPQIVVADSRAAMAVAADVFFGQPTHELDVVGVTGTNGKTTTTELLGAIFRAAGRDVAVAGNVGTPLTSFRNAEWVVCELSSFQLEDVHGLACDVAVLLNLEPDHLDRHGSFEAYRDAKLRIFERARVKIVPRGLELEGIEFAANDELPAEPLIRGVHNRENAAAATAAARAAGIADEHIAAALGTFPGVPHRLELVGERDGLRYVNDSKATNVAAARRALAAYADEPVHLILGGSLKGENFAPLAAAIGPNVRSVHLIGEAAGQLATLIVDGYRDETLEHAVAHAVELAQPGDVVLLSPACASFDQFSDFEQRGEAFRRLVTR